MVFVLKCTMCCFVCRSDRWSSFGLWHVTYGGRSDGVGNAWQLEFTQQFWKLRQFWKLWQFLRLWECVFYFGGGLMVVVVCFSLFCDVSVCFCFVFSKIAFFSFFYKNKQTSGCFWDQWGIFCCCFLFISLHLRPLVMTSDFCVDITGLETWVCFPANQITVHNISLCWSGQYTFFMTPTPVPTWLCLYSLFLVPYSMFFCTFCFCFLFLFFSAAC